MRALAAVLLGLGYLIGTAALTFVLIISSVFGHDETSADGSQWYDDVDAWQWDALFVLGLTGALAALIVVATRLTVALVAQAVLFGVGVALVVDAEVVNREQLVLGWFGTLAAGAALVYWRRR
jgi:hypothetical protein